MNPQLVLQIVAMVPSLVATIESISPASGQGPEKLEAVVNAVAPLVPAEQFPDFTANVLPKIKTYIAALVAMYKLAGLFKKGAA